MAFGSRSYGSSGYAQQNGGIGIIRTAGQAATILLNLFNRHVLRNNSNTSPNTTILQTKEVEKTIL